MIFKKKKKKKIMDKNEIVSFFGTFFSETICFINWVSSYLSLNKIIKNLDFFGSDLSGVECEAYL